VATDYFRLQRVEGECLSKVSNLVRVENLVADSGGVINLIVV
jgi:hypothetical protein